MASLWASILRVEFRFLRLEFGAAVRALEGRFILPAEQCLLELELSDDGYLAHGRRLSGKERDVAVPGRVSVGTTISEPCSETLAAEASEDDGSRSDERRCPRRPQSGPGHLGRLHGFSVTSVRTNVPVAMIAVRLLENCE